MDVERQIDGLVGRLLSWLTQPPVRPVTEPALAASAQPVTKPPTPITKTAKKPAAKKPVTKKAAAKKPRTKKPAADLDRFVDGATRATGTSGDLTAKILAALAGSANGVTLAQLQNATGGQLAAVRRQLHQLLKAGKIQRGQGIGTRYRMS